MSEKNDDIEIIFCFLLQQTIQIKPTELNLTQNTIYIGKTININDDKINILPRITIETI
jgi:hypothetical protein